MSKFNLFEPYQLLHSKPANVNTFGTFSLTKLYLPQSAPVRKHNQLSVKVLYTLKVASYKN